MGIACTGNVNEFKLWLLQIWQMKQEEVHAVAHKLLAADRVIHEQQLGWQWQGPDEDALLAGPHSPTQGTRTLTGSKKKTASQKASSEVGDAEEMPEGESQKWLKDCSTSVVNRQYAGHLSDHLVAHMQ